MKVLVVGAGNIGTTLANLLARYRAALGIEGVLLQKVRPQPFLEPDLRLLEQSGVRLLRAPSASPVPEADYVFDCRKEGAPRADLPFYQSCRGLRGACAQGSEEGFGIPFVSGTNPTRIAGERFVQVASCNTHGVVTLLRSLAGPRLEQLEEADLVAVRRSEDPGSSGRLVGASVVARHRDTGAGTHHAREALSVFATLGLQPRLVSSDVTTPSQLMHSLRFHLRLRDPLEESELVGRLKGEPLLATTRKFDSNRVFELGRRYGVQGRIYAHAVVVANNLLVQGRQIRGWAFVPQEGNTLLSTLQAFLLQTEHPQGEARFREIVEELVPREW